MFTYTVSWILDDIDKVATTLCVCEGMGENNIRKKVSPNHKSAQLVVSTPQKIILVTEPNIIFFIFS